MSPCPNRGRNGRGCSLRQTTGSLTTFPKPPFPGLARKMTPQHLCHLMSTHVRAIATLSHSSGALGWDPPCSPESREAGRMGPGPGAPRLQPAPNFPQLQAHLSRREGGPALGGARDAAGASAAGAPPSACRPPDPAPGQGRLGLPHLPPGPSATRSPRGAPPASAPRSWGPAPAPRWARAAASPAEGVPRTVSAPGPAPCPAWGSASHLPPPPPPLHAPPGRGPDPTRLQIALLSPWAGPGRSRGLS